jgi:hypothetical protein
MAEASDNDRRAGIGACFLVIKRGKSVAQVSQVEAILGGEPTR